MEKNHTSLFGFQLSTLRIFKSQWDKICQLISNAVPVQQNNEIAVLNQQIQVASQNFQESLSAPCLTIAAAGTTNSGKSTLINLLCGNKILPADPYEKTAGVSIIYHDTIRMLDILNTSGATWACGKWDNPTDREIFDRLSTVMDQYIDAKNSYEKQSKIGNSSQFRLAPPQIELRYSTLLGRLKELQLPENSTFKILDLPGLKYVGDELNASIIRQHAKSAMCLITYDITEADSKKKEALIEEVVNQVAELGGSPARIVFILNKMDLFEQDIHKDIDNNKREQRVNRVISDYKNQIISIIREKLPEHAMVPITIAKLSALPALYASQMLYGDDLTQRTATQDLQDCFYHMIPRDIIVDLPRRVEKWEPNDFQRIGEVVWKNSHAAEFFELLNKHTLQYWPQLILPQTVDCFFREGGLSAVQWVTQTVSAQLHSSHEEYENEKLRIKDVRHFLEQVHNNAKNNLLDPFNQISLILQETSDYAIIQDSIRNKLKFISIDNLPRDTMIPLYNWSDSIKKVATHIFETVGEILQDQSAINLANRMPNILPETELTKLNIACRHLRDSGYDSIMAEDGRNPSNKKGFKIPRKKTMVFRIHRAMINLFEVVNRSVTYAVNDEAKRQTQRITESMQKLLRYYNHSIEEKVKKIAGDIIVNYSALELNFNNNSIINYDNICIPINNFFDEDVNENDISDNEEIDIVFISDDQIHTYSSEPFSIKKKSHRIRFSIPSVATIIKMWKQSFERSETEVIKRFIYWLINQVQTTSTSLENIHNTLLQDYHAKLDKAANQADSMIKDIHQLQEIKEEVLTLEKQLHTLREI